MQKIMFDDRCGLTQAVLNGRKTMTRRIIKAPNTMEGKTCYGFEVVRKLGSKEVVEVLALDEEGASINNIVPKYKPGEVVAVAQNLRDMGYDPREKDWERGIIWRLDHSAAWTNKMFVCASDCIHQIRITGIRVERLQDISDEDCMKEGIVKTPQGFYSFEGWGGKTTQWYAMTPRDAFAALINKVSRKGTWESNPYVYVYEFELVK